MPAKPSVASRSAGTCFFVAATGLALSSWHVVSGSSKISVTDSDNKVSAATILAKDERLDLVALQVDSEDIPAWLPLSDDKSELGDQVFTVGFPEITELGIDPKLTEGTISGERGLGLDFLLQTSTPVQPGNSGGALVSLVDGRVRGIIALRQNFFADGSAAHNTAFAIDATSIRTAFRSLNLDIRDALRERKPIIARARKSACLVIADTVSTAPRVPRSAESDPEARWTAASSLFEAGRYLEAADLFSALSKESPQHSRAHASRYFLGLSYFNLSKWDRAIASWQVLVDRYPSSTLADDALYFAAKAALNLNECGEAKVYLRLLLDTYSSSNVTTAARQLLEATNVRLKKRRCATQHKR